MPGCQNVATAPLKPIDPKLYWWTIWWNVSGPSNAFWCMSVHSDKVEKPKRWRQNTSTPCEASCQGGISRRLHHFLLNKVPSIAGTHSRILNEVNLRRCGPFCGPSKYFWEPSAGLLGEDWVPRSNDFFDDIDSELVHLLCRNPVFLLSLVHWLRQPFGLRTGYSDRT